MPEYKNFSSTRHNNLRRILMALEVPQILTVMEVRSSVHHLVAPSMPWLHDVSYQELRPDTNIQPVGRISLDGFSARSTSVDGVPLWG